jgi:hypothetical protein
MSRSFLKLLTPVCTLIAISCSSPVSHTKKDNSDYTTVPQPAIIKKDTFSIQMDLPVELSGADAEHDSLFFIRSASGQLCIPDIDTVTKTGGHRQYFKLPAGNYIYSITTVFGEKIYEEFELDHDTDISTSAADIYDLQDVLLFDSLAQADSIKIVFSGDLSSDYRLFKLYKGNHNYRVHFSINNGKEQSWVTDSTVVIYAVARVLAIIKGLEWMEAEDTESDKTAFYIKANETMYEHYQTSETLFLETYEKFREEIQKKK